MATIERGRPAGRWYPEVIAGAEACFCYLAPPRATCWTLFKIIAWNNKNCHGYNFLSLNDRKLSYNYTFVFYRRYDGSDEDELE